MPGLNLSSMIYRPLFLCLLIVCVCVVMVIFTDLWIGCGDHWIEGKGRREREARGKRPREAGAGAADRAI